ncbi:MAG: hypothetical protein ACK5IP_22280 [Paracoccus sp. (in: a-proteobacteria)]
MRIRNRQAWNTAALVGAAQVGKLPRYEDVFGSSPKQRPAVQTGKQQEAALRVLAAAWGAVKG